MARQEGSPIVSFYGAIAFTYTANECVYLHMTLTQLRYIVALDKHRHFGIAAEHEHVTQPSLSTQIQKLEEELGVQIFDRSRSPVVPTRHGEIIIEQARTVLHEAGRLEQVAATEDAERQGELLLGIIPTVAPYVLPLFLEKFTREYPTVHLRIREMQSQEILDALRKDEIDAGLMATPLHIPGIIENVLFNEPFVVYAPAGHHLLSERTIHTSELEGESMWLLSEGHCFRDQALEVCGLQKSAGDVQEHITFESDNLETLKRLVDSGVGITLLPYLAAIQGESQELMPRTKRFTYPVPMREISLVTSRRFLKKRIADALAATIVGSIPVSLRDESRGQVVPLPTFE